MSLTQFRNLTQMQLGSKPTKSMTVAHQVEDGDGLVLPMPQFGNKCFTASPLEDRVDQRCQRRRAECCQ